MIARACNMTLVADNGICTYGLRVDSAGLLAEVSWDTIDRKVFVRAEPVKPIACGAYLDCSASHVGRISKTR